MQKLYFLLIPNCNCTGVARLVSVRPLVSSLSGPWPVYSVQCTLYTVHCKLYSDRNFQITHDGELKRDQVDKLYKTTPTICNTSYRSMRKKLNFVKKYGRGVIAKNKKVPKSRTLTVYYERGEMPTMALDRVILSS